MNKGKGGLGRGLGSLLSTPQGAPSGVIASAQPAVATNVPEQIELPTAGDIMEPQSQLRILEVNPLTIKVNPRQPRMMFSEEHLSELADSIKEHGILQPLVVSEIAPGAYELIAGERRLRAASFLGLATVPVVIRPKEGDQKKLELALIENIQRQDLNPVEEARAYKLLAETFGLRQEDIAQKMGKSRSAIANTMRLLELEEEMLVALAEGKISRSHARTLLAEPIPSRRKLLFEKMLEGGMTVREAEARAGARTRQLRLDKDPNIAAIEIELRERFGTKVTIDEQGTGGKVIIQFYSREDLKELVRKLTAPAA